MSLTTIAARFTDESVKLDGAQERRVLTTLKMIYEGGSLDGKTANFPTRDLSSEPRLRKQLLKSTFFTDRITSGSKKCRARMPALAKRSFGLRSRPFAGPTCTFCGANIR